MRLTVTQKRMKIILQMLCHVALAVPQVKNRYVNESHMHSHAQLQQPSTLSIACRTISFLQVLMALLLRKCKEVFTVR